MRSAFILGLVAIAGCASSPSYRSPAFQFPHVISSGAGHGRWHVTRGGHDVYECQ